MNRYIVTNPVVTHVRPGQPSAEITQTATKNSRSHGLWRWRKTTNFYGRPSIVLVMYAVFIVTLDIRSSAITWWSYAGVHGTMNAITFTSKSVSRIRYVPAKEEVDDTVTRHDSELRVMNLRRSETRPSFRTNSERHTKTTVRDMKWCDIWNRDQWIERMQMWREVKRLLKGRGFIEVCIIAERYWV